MITLLTLSVLLLLITCVLLIILMTNIREINDMINNLYLRLYQTREDINSTIHNGISTLKREMEK